MTSSSVVVAPKPRYPIDIESMAPTKPSSSSVSTSRDTSPSSKETIETAVQLLTGMTAEEYMKMIDPVQYHPDLFRDVVFPPEVPAPLSSQRWEVLPWVSEPGSRTVERAKLPLYLIQKKVNLFGFPPRNYHDIIHGSQRLAHHVSIPSNFTGNDVNLPDSGPTIYIPVEYPYMTKTSFDGLSYWNEPLALVYEGMGLAFPVTGYHDTIQIPVHNQGYEILHRDLFVLNNAFATFVNANSPNETISDADHNRFITDPTFMDPNDGDVFRRMNIISGFYDYWYRHQSTQPLPGFEEIPTQQFWNRIIDARWRSVWKRKNP